jgi:hypothetical protein
MDRVIVLYYGGSVNELLELIGMRQHVLTFGEPPQFIELVGRVKSVLNDGGDLRFHGRYDMGANRSNYVMLPLGSKDE